VPGVVNRRTRAGQTGTNEDVDTVVFGTVQRYRIRPRRFWAFVPLTLLLGVIAGVVWWAVVGLPGYLVMADGSAATTQRGLTEIFGSDAWYSLIGAVVGLILGILAWALFGRSGWVVVPIAVVASVVAAAVCWWLGWVLGPGPLNDRLVAAKAGDFVPIELTVRAPVAVLVWVMATIIPIVGRASLGPDPDEPGPVRRARWDSGPTGRRWRRR